MSYDHKSDLVMSYHRVRTALGILGMLLPVFLVVGGLFDHGRVEPSISDFYHTTYRDIFVGTLVAIGVFLISYRGYRRQPGEWLNDDWLATVAGLSAIGVALFPNESPTGQLATMTQTMVGIGTSPLFHYASALIFFTCLALFNFVKFARTAKPQRRKLYLFCGWVIVLSLIGIAGCSAAKISGEGPFYDLVVQQNLVFWFEAIGIWAFGLSWLVKGKADLALVESVAKMRRIVRPQTEVIDEDVAEGR